MIKDLKSMLVPVHFELIKKPFNPDQSYYAILNNKEMPRNLITKLEAKFPAQPPLLKWHPSLDVGEVIRASIKGPLPEEHLSVMKDAFVRMSRKQSFEHDVVLRSSRRKEEIRQEYADFFLKTMLDRLTKAHYIFELRATESLAARNKFIEVREDVEFERVPKKKMALLARDETERAISAHYKLAVLKGLEKVPRQMVLSTISLRQIVAEMENSEPCGVLGAYRAVQENILKTFADQLNDHVKKNMPNAVLYSASAEMRAHFLASGQLNQGILTSLSYAPAAQAFAAVNMSKHNKDQAGADQLNDHVREGVSDDILYFASIPDQEAIIEDYQKKHKHSSLAQEKVTFSKVRRDERRSVNELEGIQIDRRDEQIQSYWRAFDYGHQTIIRPQMLNSTNAQSQINEFSRQKSSNAQRVLRAVDENQVAAHADSLMEPFDKHLPTAILYALSIFPQEYPKISQILLAVLDHQVEERKLDENSLTVFNFFQSTRNTEWHNFRRVDREKKAEDSTGRMTLDEALSRQSLRSVQGHEMYWKVFDHLHEKAIRSISTQATALNPVLRELGHQSASEIQHILGVIGQTAVRASDVEVLESREILRRGMAKIVQEGNSGGDSRSDSFKPIESPAAGPNLKKATK